MTEQNHPHTEERPVQAIPMGDFPESPLSSTIRFHSADGADIMTTVRMGATVNDIKIHLDALVEGIRYAESEYGLSTAPPSRAPAPTANVVHTPNAISAVSAPTQSQPAPVPATETSAPQATHAPGITGDFFETATLKGELKPKGEGYASYWKITGTAIWKEHGIRVWPEVLESINLDLATLDAGLRAENPVTEYKLSGYIAHYVEKPHKKVTKLEPIAQ